MKLSGTGNRLLAGALAISFCAACSKPEPHLGTTATAASVDGASVVVTDSRSILPSGGLAGEESAMYEIEAKVHAVNQAKRSITLALPNGTQRTFTVPAEVRNLAQVKSGDTLRITYHQTVAFEFREPTAAEVELAGKEITAAGRARLGEMPGAAALSSKLAIVTVVSVSTDKQQLAVQASDGRVVTIQAKYPENLALAKKGQKAVVYYGEGVVAEVERLQ